jgi:hypothetical protein
MISLRLLVLVKNYSETESPRYSPDLTPSDHNTFVENSRPTNLFISSFFIRFKYRVFLKCLHKF